MAEGEYGPGRMAEPLEIVAAIENLLLQRAAADRPRSPASASSSPPARPTSRSTRCAISPTAPRAGRATRSRSRRGGRGAGHAGVSGPVAIARPAGVKTRPRRDARARCWTPCEAALPADIAVFAAAVADWRAAEAARAKDQEGRRRLAPALALTENPDILATIARRAQDRPPLVVGFAAETDDLVDHARAKLAKKGCDSSSPTTSRPRRASWAATTTPSISSRRRASRPGRRSPRTRWRAVLRAHRRQAVAARRA